MNGHEGHGHGHDDCQHGDHHHHHGDHDHHHHGGRGGPEGTEFLDLEISKVIEGRAATLVRSAADELLKEALKARLRERMGARFDAIARTAVDEFLDDVEANLAIESIINARREARRNAKERRHEGPRDEAPAPAKPKPKKR
jgi:hypothetical protein